MRKPFLRSDDSLRCIQHTNSSAGLGPLSATSSCFLACLREIVLVLPHKFATARGSLETKQAEARNLGLCTATPLETEVELEVETRLSEERQLCTSRRC